MLALGYVSRCVDDICGASSRGVDGEGLSKGASDDGEEGDDCGQTREHGWEWV